MANFALIHADRIRIFDTMQEAAAQEIPLEGYTYNILHSAKGGGYILAQYDSTKLVGYLEKKMRNVYKGFQTGQTAMPKLHMAKLNSDFTKMHAPSLKRPAIRMEKAQGPKKAPRAPGKHPGY